MEKEKENGTVWLSWSVHIYLTSFNQCMEIVNTLCEASGELPDALFVIYPLGIFIWSLLGRAVNGKRCPYFVLNLVVISTAGKASHRGNS